MIDSEITSNRCNHIWLCNRSLDGYTLQLQNGGRPCDVAQSYTSSVKRVYLSCVGFACSPAYGIPQILDKVGMAVSDIDAYEVHEAFAVSLRLIPYCLDSDSVVYCIHS